MPDVRVAEQRTTKSPEKSYRCRIIRSLKSFGESKEATSYRPDIPNSIGNQHKSDEMIVNALRGSDDFKYREADPQSTLGCINEKLERDCERESL